MKRQASIKDRAKFAESSDADQDLAVRRRGKRRKPIEYTDSVASDGPSNVNSTDRGLEFIGRQRRR